MTYSAINIGPIVKTLGLARKPRELWSASYLFSFLMKCIIEKLPQEISIISPFKIENSEKNGIGLYPDRLFVKGKLEYESIEPVVKEVSEKTGIPQEYFNVMLITADFTKDSEAIEVLNKTFDRMELFNRTTEYKDKVASLISKKYKSPLFDDAFEKNKFKIPTLAEIASIQLSTINKDKWKSARKYEQEEEGSTLPENFKIVNEDAFYKKLKEEFPTDIKSYHKYICVVQADGDNVGKTVSHKELKEGKVKEISEALLQFGKNAKEAINNFGGLPIYAGGDDLLFIAPVVGKDNTSILSLLDKLNNESFKPVVDKVEGYGLKDDKGNLIKASLSFGVSINYYKHPLYEILQNAQHLLFCEAKNRDLGKNAIALDFRKHSGGAFKLVYSKNNKELDDAFKKLIQKSDVEESEVSAISHKIRGNKDLILLWYKEEPTIVEIRNLNFYKKFLELKEDEKDTYKTATLEVLNELYKTSKGESIVQNMYSMLRLAKFIKGEELRDE